MIIIQLDRITVVMLINWMYELLWLAKYAQSLVTYPTSTTGNPIVAECPEMHG